MFLSNKKVGFSPTASLDLTSSIKAFRSADCNSAAANMRVRNCETNPGPQDGVLPNELARDAGPSDYETNPIPGWAVEKTKPIARPSGAFAKRTQERAEAG